MGWELFEITGTGTAFQGRELIPSAPLSRFLSGAPKPVGVIEAIVLRMSTGAAITAFDLWLVDHVADFTYTATPPEEHVRLHVSALAVTAHASNADLQSVIDRKVEYKNGLGVVFDPTGTGAWTVQLALQISQE